MFGDQGSDLIIGGAMADSLGSVDPVAATDPTTETGRDIIFGDNGFIGQAYPDQMVPTSGAPAFSDNGLVYISTLAPSDGGADQIEADAGDDIVFGGAGGDRIDGGTKADILFGDHGLVVTQFGSVPSPKDVREARSVIRILSEAAAIGGADVILAGTGNDLVIGGAAGDNIRANRGSDIVLGDNGALEQNASAAAGGAEVPFDTTAAVFLRTTSPTVGGADNIRSGLQNDIVLGGQAGDEIRLSSGRDAALGDNGEIELRFTPVDGVFGDIRDAEFIVRLETTDLDAGGADQIYAENGQDIVIGGSFADRLDGGEKEDLILGDNVTLDRTLTEGVMTNARYRMLTGSTVYDRSAATGDALVEEAANAAPTGSPLWTDFLASVDPAQGTEFGITFSFHANFGGDNIAGGAADDVIFGQFGDDIIQGDGFIDIDVAASVNADGTLALTPSAENVSDGDDYIEGNAGADVVFGNLGQDDIVGGTSTLFGVDLAHRSDGSDILFGGAGLQLAINEIGDQTEAGHARDADFILGDNGNIFRILGDDGQNATYAYDTYTDALPAAQQLKIVVRGHVAIDYTLGGDASDIGTGDLVFGEGGDDKVFGMRGNDVLFGNGRDDDLVGGVGLDRIFGGSGIDAILGDDGVIFTSRHGTAEPLSDIAASTQTSLTMDTFTGSVEYIDGTLRKDVALLAWESGGADIGYGGLGDDWMHMGAGDDAASGAEALAEFYNDVRPITGTPIAFDPVTEKLEFYDADNPRQKIDGFFLNFAATDGDGVKIEDGKDRIFGDLGNDWLVGGTGNDRMFGGLGADVMNADDNHDNGTTPGANDLTADPQFADGDFAFGGNGRDVLIGNTGNDRLIDWKGEYNTYLVPFSQNGEGTIVRSGQPATRAFLLELGEASGADQNFTEPNGELGLSQQGDAGGPRDPQNINGTDSKDTSGSPQDDSGVTIDIHGGTAGLGGAPAAAALLSGAGAGTGASTSELSDGTVTMYDSGLVSLPIADFDTVQSVITVVDEGIVSDVNVSVSITHARVSDLDVYLVAPDGQRVALFTDVSDTGADVSQTSFDDGATTSITAGTAPFNGTFTPVGDLGALEGIQAAGAWTLEVSDDSSDATGTLNGWSLEIDAQTATAVAGIAPDATVASEPVMDLRQEDLSAFYEAAAQRWSPLLNETQRKVLSRTNAIVVDLVGTSLSARTGNTIFLDRDAGGSGWRLGSSGSGVDLMSVLLREIADHVGADRDLLADLLADQGTSDAQKGEEMFVSSIVLPDELDAITIFAGEAQEGLDVDPSVADAYTAYSDDALDAWIAYPEPGSPPVEAPKEA